MNNDVKKMFLMLAGVGIFILVAGAVVQTNQGKQTVLSGILPKFGLGTTPAPTAALGMKIIKIGGVSILATIADTDDARSKGLSGITNLPANQGMLFVFSSRGIRPSFWMKGMKIPLDFIWIVNNQVVQLDTNISAPAPNTADNQLKTYTPAEPIDYVLEVNAGFVARNNIMIGNNVMLNL